jgi:hypothetical protein
MDKLNKYLDKQFPKTHKIDIREHTCRKKDIIISSNLLLPVCVECGLVQNKPYTKNQYQKHPSFINKTYMGYYSSNKYNNIKRILKWSNYDKIEVRDDKLLKYMDRLPLDRDIITRAKRIFIEEYHKVKTRGNVKKGLICYSLYFSSIMQKEPLDINELFKLLQIQSKHYNNANNKINSDKLYYPKNILFYLKKLDNKIDKNDVIIKYNKIFEEDYSIHQKTLLLSVMYFFLKQKQLLDQYDFFELFKIHKDNIIDINR